ncbi:MAG: class I SAM-dependent methyltransferase [Tistlia sp.]|uniref:methyltransferase domain-containing protein n=1 Tax=Tistlia sp. TaxID=3057121 RepID=UPI0034A59168
MSDFACPVCGVTGPFRDHPRSGRRNASCGHCGARERHRLLALYLKGHPDRRPPLAGRRLLHVSPEAILEPLLADLAEYVTGDLTDPEVDLALDLTATGLPAGSFGAVMANHVLEHIPDDRAAFAEMFRILAPGGLAVITVPVVEGWERTYEDPAIDTPALRELHFGRHDHVRYYGRDLRQRIAAAGFDLEVWQPSPADCLAYALHRGASVFVGHRP